MLGVTYLTFLLLLKLETYGKMVVVTASDVSKLDCLGIPSKQSSMSMDNTSSALHLGKTQIIPFLSSDQTQFGDPEEDYVHGKPSQAQITVTCLLKILNHSMCYDAVSQCHI